MTDLPKPHLSISIVDEDYAELTIQQEIPLSAYRGGTEDRQYRLLVRVYGEDGFLRGDDDYLGYFTTSHFSHGVTNFSDASLMERKKLDEDKGRGAIRRARERRDKDEIYVITLLELQSGTRTYDPFTMSWRRHWGITASSPPSNIIGNFRF